MRLGICCTVASSVVPHHVEMAKRGQHADGMRERSAMLVTIGVVGQLLQHVDACKAATVLSVAF